MLVEQVFAVVDRGYRKFRGENTERGLTGLAEDVSVGGGMYRC